MLVLFLGLTLGTPTLPSPGLSGDLQAFEVIGLRPTELASLRTLSMAKLAEIFRVVVKPDMADGKPLPMLGEYEVTAKALRFVPRFPPAPGVTYRLTYDGRSVDVAVPKVDPTPRTSVTAIYPSASKLPENTLRFYVQFSGPMNLKDIYRHVRLVRDDGKVVEFPFLELDEQLWSPEGTRLTLLCDPGRVKRGLVPREQDGPIFEEGRRYTLSIDRNWEDADGRKLKETATKTFDVGPPDDEPVDPANWSVMSPTKGSTNPLIVRLAKPLDRGLLARVVWVEDAAGNRVDGKITVGGGERVLTFAPAKAWAAGPYHLTINTRLEDVCGNSVGQSFEVDVFKPVQQKIEAKTVRRTFEVR